ncbi:MAG: hypothetical protein ICV60_07470 [Pyrinomonadaceae bacterium]|nr:hypothetical protein [Pyrinomonadaceae bacterium]
MSAEQDRVRAIAERIAQRVSQQGSEREAPSRVSAETADDLASVRESLDELKRKLVNIERHLAREKDSSENENSREPERERNAHARPPTAAQSPWLSGIYVPAAHPSQERFDVEEAAVSELVDFFEKEKVCELEPGGKPCTHCDMCSTRGF